MSNSYQYLRLSLVAIVAAVITACGGNQITRFEPAQDTTIESPVGQTLAFSIEGPEPEDKLNYRWTVTQYDKQNQELSSVSLAGDNVFEREYQVSADDVSAFYTEVSVSYGRYTVIGDPGGLPITFFTPLSTVTWEILTSSDQMAPIYVGDAFLRNQNDLERLRGFEVITGDVLMTDPDIESTDALAQLQRIDGDIVVSSFNNERDFTKFQFNEQIAFSGALTIVDNVSLRRFTGLPFIKQLEKLVLRRNDYLQAPSGLNNLTSVAAIEMTLNPAIKSLDGLQSVVGQVDDITLWGNTQLGELTGLNSISHIERLSIGVYPNQGRIPPSPDIVDLRGLEGLTSLGELIVHEVSSFESLNGLQNLQQLGSITLLENPVFHSIDALSSLTSLDNLILRDLPEFNGLSVLGSVNSHMGTLHLIDLPKLDSLQGVHHLESIDDFQIGTAGQFNRYGDHNRITDFSDFENITRIGRLAIHASNELLSLAGFETLEEVDRLFISYNRQLSDVSQLSNLTQLNEFSWADNENVSELPDLSNINHLDRLSMSYFFLDDLDGLDNLRTAGEVIIRTSETLTDVNALSSLESVSGDFRLSTASRFIQSIDLGNLETVGGEFAIVSNLALEDIDVGRLSSVGGDFIFFGNIELCTSTAESVLDQVLAAGGVGGDIHIENNKACL